VTTALDAISESITHDRIVTLSDPSPDTLRDLIAESDDSAEYRLPDEDRMMVEFWGTTDDGCTWRVHVDRGDHA